MDANVQGRLEESQAKVYHLDLEHAEKVLSMQETNKAEPAEVEEVIKVVTTSKLMKKVVTTGAPTITAALVPKASAPRRRRGVIIQDPEEAATASVIVQSEVKRKEREDNTVMGYQALKRKLVTEAQERKKNNEKGEKDIKEEGSKRKSEISEQRAAKKQRINEEMKEIKTHLQIISNDEDDVCTEATPLALKALVVDYQIHHKYNKPFYKIIRADGTHQLFLSFITLLKNFDREDLEMMKYPLTRFTLEQMLDNVRLEVEKESEMSLELLRKGGVKSRRVRDICWTIQAKISKKMLVTDGQSDRTFQTLENMFRACVRNLVVVGILTFCEAEIRESKMIGFKLEQETTKVVVIKERLKKAKDRQKS
nr:hypothetical protein [Tanacetum cinerariifolium]